MTWTPNDKEIETLITAEFQKRYEYFIHKVSDQGQLWSLRDEGGWRLMSDNSGKECIPLWPHEKYAKFSATGIFSGSKPQPISLDEFMNKWITGMIKDGRFAAVFPTSNDKGILILPQKLLGDLEAEREKYK